MYRKETNEKWKKKHRDTYLAGKRRFYQNHREKLLTITAEYREKNIEKRREVNRNYTKNYISNVVKNIDSGLYRKYVGMKARCTNSCGAYKYYKGKGIIVEWKNYLDFKRDMYDSYTNHLEIYGHKETTLDRIDVDKNYCKENCRWATWKEQANNRSNSKRLQRVNIKV